MASKTALRVYVDRLNFQQHPICARQLENANENLFLTDPSTSHLLAVWRPYPTTNTCVCTRAPHSESSSNQTLVNSSECHQCVTSVHDLEDEKALLHQTVYQWKHFSVVSDIAQLKVTEPDQHGFEAFVIEQQHSYSPFNITKEVFDTLCRELAIFSRFGDMVTYMGHRHCELEVAPPRPRYRYLGGSADDGFELTYGLRWIEENNRRSVWSLRQSVVYHKFDHQARKSAWILVGPTLNAKRDIEEFIEHDRCSDAQQQVALHLAFVQSAVFCWRPYLAHLTDQVGKHINNIKFANPKDEERLGPDYIDLAKTSTRLQLKLLEDQIIDSTLALRANRDLLLTMQKLFRWHVSGQPNHDGSGSNDTYVFVDFILERTRDIDMLITQLDSLKAKLTSCTKIASSFSELSNGDALQRLTLAAQKESKHTAILTERAQKDGAAMKGLTVVAVVFLPTTVVLNFFSATFVNTSQGEIVLIGKWWLFLVIGVPLTLFTLLAWALWVYRQGQLPDEEATNG